MPIDVEATYRKYGPMVLRRCRTLLRDEGRALDAMQDVFVNLLRNQEKLTGDYPSSLLFRMATNTCLNLLRSQRRKPENRDEELLLNIAAADETESGVWQRDLLDYLFHQEKPSTRAMAVMHYVDGLTLAEVAREVGLSVSGVRKRLREFQTRVKALKESGHERTTL